MKTLWTEGMYTNLKCEWCDGKEDDLYKCDDEVVCRTCLQEEEVNENEQLTLWERNRT